MKHENHALGLVKYFVEGEIDENGKLDGFTTREPYCFDCDVYLPESYRELCREADNS